MTLGTTPTSIRVQQLRLLDLAQQYLDLADRAQAAARELIDASDKVDQALDLLARFGEPQEGGEDLPQELDAAGPAVSITEDSHESSQPDAPVPASPQTPAAHEALETLDVIDTPEVLGEDAPVQAPSSAQAQDEEQATPAPEAHSDWHPFILAAARISGLIPRLIVQGESSCAFRVRRALTVAAWRSGWHETEIAALLETRTSEANRLINEGLRLTDTHPDFRELVDKIKEAIG